LSITIKNIFNQKGFGTLEALVTAAIIPLAAIALAEGLTNVKKAETTVNRKWEASQVLENVAETLTSSNENDLKTLINSQISDEDYFHSSTSIASLGWLSKWERPDFVTDIKINFRVFKAPFVLGTPTKKITIIQPLQPLGIFDIFMVLEADYYPRPGSPDKVKLRWTKAVTHYL
jgi:hypothetical protein